MEFPGKNTRVDSHSLLQGDLPDPGIIHEKARHKETYICRAQIKFLCWVFIAARVLSLVAVSRGYPRAAVHGLLVAVASLVAELRLLACGFQ